LGLPVEILSDWPLWVICQSGRSLTSAHRAVPEIARATVGDASSGTPTAALRVGRYSQEGLFNGPEELVGVPNARVGLTSSVP